MFKTPSKKFKMDTLLSDGSARLKILPQSEEYSITTLHSEELTLLKKILKNYDSRTRSWKNE